MKIFTTKAVAFTAVLFASFSLAFSQNNVPFKARFQSTIKGDMSVIANNILNRVDYDNDVKAPYHNTSNYSKLNDDFMMAYIDIDNDESTFSSSNAELLLDNSRNKKIVYAGLYWSATYKYNSGTQKKENKFAPIDDKREAFNQIKVKLPNQDGYTTVSGETIFDGVNSKEYKDSSPYVVYADITSLVQELDDPSGIYTVANIKATEGTLSGGSSAGWTMFFVYEDSTMSEKFISSFDGFSELSDKSVNLKINGFETVLEGNVKAKMACAALEGDTNLINDQFMLGASDKAEATMNTATRKAYNFFNSSITNDDQYVTNRFPNSKNTLGYDTCMMNIPNKNNSVFDNKTKEAHLDFKSSGDKCFVFFTAFNIESKNNSSNVAYASNYSIDNAMKNLKVTPSDSNYSIDNAMKNLKETSSKNDKLKIVTSNSEMVADLNKTISSKKLSDKNYTIDTNVTSKDNDVIKIHSEYIADQSSNYYIIANVFSVPENATNFIKELKDKGIEANYFVNPINNYRYVYLNKVHNEDEAISQYTNKLNNTYNDQIWILSVNNNNKPSLEFNTTGTMLTDSGDD